MDVPSFLRQSGILVVAGKGGVGKTTVTAAIARLAADVGLSVLVVDLEGKSGVPAAFGRHGSLEYDEVLLYEAAGGEQYGRPSRAAPAAGAPSVAGGEQYGRPSRAAPAAGAPSVAGGEHAGSRQHDRQAGRGVGWGRDRGEGRERDGGRRREDTTDPAGTVAPGTVRARRITPDDALLEYLADHGMRRVSKRLVSSGILDVVATAIPGISDILVLGKVKQLERAQVADLVLVDAPATGHAMTFLSSARGLLDAARSGPVRAQAAEVVELLADPTRCQVMLVTLPEEMPVNEVVEAAFALEDRIGVGLGPVVVNACMDERPGLQVDPAEAARSAGVELTGASLQALGAAARFSLQRLRLQQEQRQRLAGELPLAQLTLPSVPGSSIGPPALATLAGALADAIGAMASPKEAEQ